jgi:hypothetical protein
MLSNTFENRQLKPPLIGLKNKKNVGFKGIFTKERNPFSNAYSGLNQKL